jgi:hypothetical protein
MSNEFAPSLQAEKSVFSVAEKSSAMGAFFLQSLRMLLLCVSTLPL